MKTHYEVLGVDVSASPEAVKHAFRTLISRYHPDKVEHLGPEFTAVALRRAAELTEAYRVLVEDETRRQYDESLRHRVSAPPSPEPSVEMRSSPGRPVIPFEPPLDQRTQAVRDSSHEFVRREAISRLREAVVKVTGWDQLAAVPGLDAVFVVGKSAGILRKRSPELVLLVKVVHRVDGDAVRLVWGHALRACASYGSGACILLLGHAVASASELSLALAGERRKARHPGPVLVPVDMRDWEALFPPEAPASVRAILKHLRAGAA